MKSRKKIVIIGLVIFSVVVSGTILIAYQINTHSVPYNSSTIQLERFVEMAKNTTMCSDNRNEIFVIDESVVFWAVEGNCPDASYHLYLFGKTPDETICSLSDSIAGPQIQCNNESYQEMFQTITSNLDTENLGLGPDHQVRQITV